MEFNWLTLQNGSDIRGVAVKGVAGEEVNLDEKRTEILGRSFYQWLNKKGYKEDKCGSGQRFQDFRSNAAGELFKGIPGPGRKGMWTVEWPPLRPCLWPHSILN